MKRGSVWLGMAVLWAAYSTMFAGYCWLRGYDISPLGIVSPVNYYKGTWPPPLFTGTGVFPSGRATTTAAGGGSSGTSVV